MKKEGKKDEISHAEKAFAKHVMHNYV